MFTGIVEEVGIISRILHSATISKLKINANIVTSDLKIGDSIAVDGVCLTATDFSPNCFEADVQKETINRTCFSVYKAGNPVNLERALAVNSRFGGHYVQGHIDGTARVRSFHQEQNDWILKLEIPPKLQRYIVEKGFIAVNGLSLTIASIYDTYNLHIIPHTREFTTLKYFKPGTVVNIEVDIISKYVEKLYNVQKL